MEVGTATADSRLLVRDTKDRAGAVLKFGPAAWREFAARLKSAGA